MPVTLDPWQAIVGVGWPLDEFLAFQLAINRQDPDDPTRGWSIHEIPCTPPEGDPPPGGALSWPSLESFHYVWDAFSQSTPITSGYTWRNDSWGSTAIASITGLPELPLLHSHAAHEIAARAVIGPPHLSKWPRAEWVDPASSPHASDVPVPFNAELRFDVAAAVTLQMRGGLPDGGPWCSGTNMLVWTEGDMELTYIFDPLEIGLSAVRSTARGRLWKPVAAKVIHPTGSAPVTSGSVWVLCEPA